MRSRILGLALGFCLLIPIRSFADQDFQIDFDGWTDVNGNGRIDCSEPVTYRIALFQASAPAGPETGTITVPFNLPVRWRYTPGTIAPDVIFSDGCTFSVLQGNDPSDVTAVLSYTCDPRVGNPLDDNYFFQFRVSGVYLGGSSGPITVDAENDRTSPTTASQHWVDSSAGPLNPCAPPPDLRLTKAVQSGDGTPGSTLVYGLSVTNFGNGGATNVQIQETVPQLTSFDVAGSSAGWSCAPDGNAGSSCTLSVGSLGVGASANRTFAVRVTSSLPPGAPATISNTACASSNPADDLPANNCGSTSTPVGNPDLRMTKSVASGGGTPGTTLIYNLAVDNLGNRDAAGVQLTETVPGLSTFLPASSSPGWSCSPSNNAGSTCALSVGTLAAGSSANRTFAVQLAARFPANPPSIDNTACASTTTGGDPATNNCGSTSTPPGGNPDLQLAKSVASGNGNPGSVLVYQLAVSNGGTRDAAGVALHETVPQLTTFRAAGSSPGWTCTPDGNAGSSCTLSLGAVAAGSMAAYTFAVQVASSLPATPPSIDNSACVSTTSGGDPAGNDCGSTSTPPGGNPDLRMSKSIASGNGSPGSVLVYQLAVSNGGTRDAAGVAIRESVPQLTTFRAAGSSPGWSCTPDGNAGSSCTLSLGTVAAGSSASYTFAVQVASSFPADPPAIDNSACVSTTSGGDPAGNDCGSTTTPPGGNPDLRLSKSVASGDGSPGSVLVYQLAVSNGGTRDAAGAALRESVPQLTTFRAAGSSPGWTCTPDGNAGSSCTLSLGTVAAGSSATYTFAVQVASSFPANPPAIDNSACVSTTSTGDPAGNDCGSTSTPPGGNPDLRISKSVASGDGSPGSVLVYQLTVSNGGTRDAAGVAIRETVPQLTTFRAAGSSPGWTCTPDGSAGSSCTLSLGTAAAGSSATYTFAVQVASSFPADPPAIDNSACVSTTTGGDPASNDCGSTSTPPGGNPDLRLSKSVASGDASPGSVLVYQLAVTNAGTRDAAGVTLHETVPQLTTFRAAGSSPEWSCTPDGSAGNACTLIVGTLAAGASATYSFAVQVANSFPPNPPAIDNSACVSTTSGGDPASNDCGSTSTPPGGNPDLRLSKSVASGDGSPGSLLVYHLALSNGGTREAAEVALHETVPQLTSFRAAGSSPGWTCTPDGNAGSACTLSIGTVAAGASATYTFAVQVAGSFPPNPPAIDNSACISTTSTGDPSVNDCGSVSTPPGGNPDLVITKNLTSGTVGPNAVLVFTLSLRNQGNREATGVVLRETVSENSVFEPAGSSPDWNCTPDGNAGASCALHVGVVEAGASSSFAFAVRLRADLPTDARISNTACAEQPARANDPAGNDCFTLVVDPPAAEPRTDLELALGVDGSPQRTGDPFTFTLTVRNASTAAADGLRIAVSLPSFGTEPTEFDPACHRSGGGAVLECSVSHLAGSASVSFSWKQFARQAGAYTVAAELIEATPDDVDSVPGNGAHNEDDYAEVNVSVSGGPGPHEIPTLSSVGISVMVSLLVALGVVFLKRRAPRGAR